MRWVAALVASGLSALLPVRAHASLSARLVYVRDAAAATCPNEESLRRAVAGRVGYEPFFPWAKTTVVVDVRGAGTSLVAHVQLVDESGMSRGVRELRAGPACRGLIDAVALAISIALDAVEGTRPSPPSPVSADPSPAPEPAPSSAPEPASGAPSVPSSVAPPSPGRAAAAVDRDDAAPRSARGTRARVGVDAFAAIGTAPEPVSGLGVWVAAQRGFGSLGLEGRADAPDTAAFAAGGRATILLFAGNVDACAHVGPTFVCALGSLGWLHASGSDVQVSRSGSAYALGVGPRAGIDLPLNAWFALDVHGDLLFNVLRPAVALNGAVWSLPSESGILAVGLAYGFL
ncbi:MAG TPA: hypothetical protein VE987_17030 [Polyangiaceae bacterium]|nr:hypothetical protein [Polyangiaceae bacterium]